MSLYIMTLAEMKSVLGLPDTEDDTVLTMVMEFLQGRIDDHCRRTLLRAENVVEYFDGNRTSIYVKSFPIESIASIYIDGDQEWPANTLLPSTDYVFNGKRGRIVYGRGQVKWPVGIQNIKVTYTGGYVACDGSPEAGQAAMPEGIRRGFMLQLNFEWRNLEQLGLSQVSSQGMTVQQGAQVSLALKRQTFLPEVETCFEPYVRVVGS